MDRRLNTAISETDPSKKFTRGYTICIVATVLWSSAAVFIRYLTETYQIPPLVLAFWRDLTVALVIMAVLALLRPSQLRLDSKHTAFILVYGFILSIFNALWTVSVDLNGAAVSTVLAYSSAAITAVAGWRFLGESLGWVKAIAVTLSLAGCVFVSGAYDPSAWRLNPVGVTTGLLSGAAFAGYSLMGRLSSERQLYPWTAMVYTFGIAAFLLFSYNLASDWFPAGVGSKQFLWLGADLSAWLVLVVLAIVPTIGGYGLYSVSLTYLPASVANVIATLEPAMTALLAYLFLGESFTSPQWLGSFLILGGVLLLRLREKRKG